MSRMKDPQEVDRQAVRQKFMEKIAQYTLDDLGGRLPLQIAQSLRSEAFAEAWEIELLKLQGNCPAKSEFRDKIVARLQEARRWVKKAAYQRHVKSIEKRRALKKPSSIGNRSQVAAIVYQGYMMASATAGLPREDMIERACEDAIELIERMSDGASDTGDAP